jgi:hypothetical protein
MNINIKNHLMTVINLQIIITSQQIFQLSILIKIQLKINLHKKR